ncbi:MAG: isoprenylcysteine carboxylmethyltransferase family protein [Acidobacteriota bacterium]
MTRSAFTALVIAVVLQRLVEVRVSRRHERHLRARGAVESAATQMPLMVALHAAWLAAMVVEVWVLQPPFRPWLAGMAFAGFAAGQTLRLLAMYALGPRWTVRVLTLPSADPVTHGVYRYVRHPNYLGVVLEMATLPLVHGAVWTAVVFSMANAGMLTVRIRAEEAALDHDNAYQQHFGARARFLPTSREPRPPS